MIEYATAFLISSAVNLGRRGRALSPLMLASYDARSAARISLSVRWRLSRYAS